MERGELAPVSPGSSGGWLWGEEAEPSTHQGQGDDVRGSAEAPGVAAGGEPGPVRVTGEQLWVGGLHPCETPPHLEPGLSPLCPDFPAPCRACAGNFGLVKPGRTGDGA